MSHDYNITVAGTAIDTIVDRARLIKWAGGTRRGANLLIPYRDGEYSTYHKWHAGTDILLETALPADTTSAASTALSAVQELFADFDSTAVTYDDPDNDKGTLRALVELLDEPVPTQNRFVYLFPLRNPKGSWEANSASNASAGNPPTVTTDGDRPIDDMILTFSGTGFLEHTDSAGRTSRITIDSGAGGTTPYTVDCGARTIVDAASASKDAYLTVTQPWWMRFEPNKAQSFTSDVNVAVSWRDKWA